MSSSQLVHMTFVENSLLYECSQTLAGKQFSNVCEHSHMFGKLNASQATHTVDSWANMLYCSKVLFNLIKEKEEGLQ